MSKLWIRGPYFYSLTQVLDGAMRDLTHIAIVLASVLLFSIEAKATPTFVYHEYSSNVITPVSPECRYYVETLSPSPSLPYTLRFKAGYRFSANEFRVYYTTDGSIPSGSFGLPSGTTQVVSGFWSCGPFAQDGSGQFDNIATGTLPMQPLGTLVKYVVSAWHTSGGPEVFGNTDSNCPEGGCPKAIFSYQVCDFSLSKSMLAFPASGGMGSVDVMTTSGCGWRAESSDPDVATIISGGGVGNGTITFSVTSNTTTHTRYSRITVAGQALIVGQGVRFNDVPTNHPFYTEIGKLSGAEITKGCGSQEYCPDQPVSRQQMAAFIMRALREFNPPAPTTQRFSDVQPDNIFYSYIDLLAARNITLGCSANPPQYCPNDTVTRAQMAAFLMRALGEFNPPPPAAQRFNDVPSTNPFYAFIDRMAVLQITLGCGNGNYCPNDGVTRAQMAAFLVRAFGL
jgi:hypothetical protein